MKKLLVMLIMAVMLTVGANAAFEQVNFYNNDFSDVPDSAWYANDVKTAYELGFMSGKGNGIFAPEGNVTVVEGITIASRLNATYNGVEIPAGEKKIEGYRLDFDDESVLVDLSERNSKNQAGVNFKHSTGYIKDGALVCEAGIGYSGSYDPQIHIEGLELAAKDYNKVTIRMKIDALPNIDDAKRAEVVETFFKTSTSPNYSADMQVNVNLKHLGVDDFSEYFEFEIDFSALPTWKDYITGFRFDPTNDNGIYTIDYIVFSKNDAVKTEPKWYDMYIDFAIDQGIIAKGQFLTDDYNRNITRREMCDLIVGALPEEVFGAINDVKGIPDVMRDEKNADIYLMLYKAGILLGDTNGNLNPNSDIKRSEISAIINRVALEQNRVQGTIDADWSEQGNEYDIEFNSQSVLKSLEFEAESVKIQDGALVLVANDRGPKYVPQFDPKITVKNVNIDASKYTKLKVRMKVEFIGEIEDTKFDFYFRPAEDEGLSEPKSCHYDFISNSYVDPAGWYVMEVDLLTATGTDKWHLPWEGNIVEYRFDPANTNGIYTIDYIRLVPRDPLYNASHDKLTAAGYTATEMLQDADYENGFYVKHPTDNVNLADRKFQYNDGAANPTWVIAPHHATVDPFADRDTSTDKNTLKDTKGVTTVVYNPDEKSLSMRLDATKVYEGKAHPNDEDGLTWWPHLLIDQSYSEFSVDKEKNSADADRIFVELDMRVTDFKDTTNTDGLNNASYLAYFYLLTDKNPESFIWFGLHLFNDTTASTNIVPMWKPDSAAHQFIYALRPADIFGGIENSFNPEAGKVAVSDEWKHIRVDVTDHVKQCIEWANKDNAFGVPVTLEDMYFGGANIGFEIHGNYDMTVEIKNFNMIAYNK